MVSLITRLLLIIQFGAAFGIYTAFLRFTDIKQNWLAILLSIAIVLIVRMLITGNNFLIAYRFRSNVPSAYRLTTLQAIRLYFEEFKASMLSSSWSMPFFAVSGYMPYEVQSLPVLLIHGYGCNSGYWMSLSRKLRAAKIPHHAVNLEPVFGDIDSFVLPVHKAVEALCEESKCEKIIIVGHSMGGLVARAYMRDFGDARIAKAITLGTPHHGTGLAHFGIGDNSMQMRWAGTFDNGNPSPWLQKLASAENSERYALFVSIYSYHDNIISPQLSSHIDGARNIALHGIGHVALGVSSRVQELVIDEILKAKQFASGDMEFPSSAPENSKMYSAN